MSEVGHLKLEGGRSASGPKSVAVVVVVLACLGFWVVLVVRSACRCGGSSASVVVVLVVPIIETASYIGVILSVETERT